MITGVAISPLLGVGAVGAYTWWNAPVEKRARLDWYAQPWFWIPALLLVALIGVKDILGTAAPTALKKPFDIAEIIENKISGLVAAGAFLPLIISVFPESAGGGTEALQHSVFAAGGFAAIDAGTIGNLLLTPLAIALFIVVWLASHAINILILLSPFTSLDTALKGLRIGMLGLVSGTAFLNPYLGATTSQFLERLGMSSLAALPSLAPLLGADAEEPDAADRAVGDEEQAGSPAADDQADVSQAPGAGQDPPSPER
jgi:hypothetical protein